MVQQRGLTDARLSMQDQDTAVPAPRGLQHSFEYLAFALPPEQLLAWRPFDRLKSW